MKCVKVEYEVWLYDAEELVPYSKFFGFNTMAQARGRAVSEAKAGDCFSAAVIAVQTLEATAYKKKRHYTQVEKYSGNR